MSKWGILSIVVFIGIFVSLPAYHANIRAKAIKISPLALRDTPDKSVLVVMKAQADLNGLPAANNRTERIKNVVERLKNLAQEKQADIRSFLNDKGADYRPFYILNALVVYKPSDELIHELAARDDVEKIVGDPQVRLSPPFVSSVRAPLHRAGIEPNITFTDAPKVWEEMGARGETIVVAGQDTGVDWKHPALKNKYRGLQADGSAQHDYNWHDSIRSQFNTSGTNKCGYDLSAPCDDDEHGTHTMGTIVGDDGVGNQIGMAPKAQWMACRNMDAGLGTPSTYIECFEFFLAPYPVHGDAFADGDPSKAPHVINNSWGCPSEEGCEADEMVHVLQALKAAGIMVVVSAGNEGSSCATIEAQPATLSGLSISVGAIEHRSSSIAGFSSRGPSRLDGGLGPTVSAPGVNIRSSVPGGSYNGFMWSGTSMAGPHVAGLVALMWSAVPSLEGRIDDTVALVRSSAVPKTSTQSCGGVAGSRVPNNTFGYGIINAYQAVVAAKNAASGVGQ